MELNYKLCEATLHDSLTKRRSSDRTELNAIINIATDFAQLNFILDRFKRLAIGKNIAFYSEYILVTMFHRSVELK